MRPAIRCLLLGSILLAAGCRENVVLDASGDAALQSSLSRLAVTLPEKQREAFVADVLKLAFSDAELKQFLDVPHDRKPGVAYVPAGSYVRFRQWNGFALDQLGSKVKEKKAAKPSAPAAPTLPSNELTAVVSAETPEPPEKSTRTGRLVTIAALGHSPIPSGRTLKNAAEYEDLRDENARKTMLENDEVILLTKSTDVVIEKVLDGWVFCRAVDPALKKRPLIVREKYLEKK